MGRFLVVLWNSDPKIDMIWGSYTPFGEKLTGTKGIDQCMIVFGRRNAKQFSFRSPNLERNFYYTKDVFNLVKSNYTSRWDKHAVELFFNDPRTYDKLRKGYFPVNVNNKHVVNCEAVDLTAFTALMAGKNYN